MKANKQRRPYPTHKGTNIPKCHGVISPSTMIVAQNHAKTCYLSKAWCLSARNTFVFEEYIVKELNYVRLVPLLSMDMEVVCKLIHLW